VVVVLTFLIVFSLTFHEKETDRKQNEEALEVKKLDEWTPAAPLAPGLS